VLPREPDIVNPCSGLPLLEKNPTCHKNLAQIKMSLIQPFPMQQLTKMSRHRDWDIACKVYIGNLGNNASKYEIEDAFGKYGPLRNVWVARNPPGFAFVEFEDPRDAEDSVRGLDGTRVCGERCRVEMSSGASRGGDRDGGDGDRGDRGDRRPTGGGRGGQRRSRSKSRSRSRSGERRRARRSPSYRSMSRSRSRSATPPKRRRRSRSASRSD